MRAAAYIVAGLGVVERGLGKLRCALTPPISLAAAKVYPESLPEALEACRRTDQLQLVMAQLPQTELPLVHRFTPGLYVREIFMPKGTVVISKIHKTEHPYVVSKGVVSVWIDGVGVQKIVAPYTGITKPGTRRILYIHEDTVWTTFHPTDETDLARIEEAVIQKHDPLAGDASELLVEGIVRQLLGS